MQLDRFKSSPIMGILRGIEAGVVEPLTEEIIAAGLVTIEITMNTAGAPSLIKRMTETAKGRLMIGAGTVLTLEDLHKALDAGATFIVMPTTESEIIEHCVKNNIPVFPGAFTPQEIYNAWRMGASMVKVFPAKFFGPEYFKEIKGPFNKIELLACGGVNEENIRSFFIAGASAVAFGSSIFKKEWLARREFSHIGQNIKNLLASYNKD